MSDLTQILSQVESGDASAAEKLLPLVYEELRKLAAAKLCLEKPGQTLQATTLVHEAYLRLVGNQNAIIFKDRGYFFAAAATAMRRILIEAARKKKTLKRGGGMYRQSVEAVASPDRDDDLVALDEALQRLASQDPVKAKLVELRFFGGLTGEQAAESLGISPTTADRHWRYARAWLRAEISGVALDS